MSSEEVSSAVRRARLLALHPHPNLAQIREPVVDTAEVLLIGDFVDGESLGSLWLAAAQSPAKPSLDVWVRVMLDVLAGLQALHGVRDTPEAAVGLFHGELTPRNVIVGIDGITRLIHQCRIGAVGLMVPGASPYLAPELLLRDPVVDPRSDLYSAGALLWEAIAGRPLFEQDKTSDVIRKVLSGPPPTPPVAAESPWASALLPVVAQALSITPSGRFADAAEMRARIESAAAGHVAPHVEVSRWVCELAGARVQERRSRHGGAPIVLPHYSAPPKPLAPIPVEPAIQPPPAPPVPPPPFGFDALPSPAAHDPPPRLASTDPLQAAAPPSTRKARSALWVASAIAAVVLALGAVAMWVLRAGSSRAAESALTAAAGASAATSQPAAETSAAQAKPGARADSLPRDVLDTPAAGASAVAAPIPSNAMDGHEAPEPAATSEPPESAPAAVERRTPTTPRPSTPATKPQQRRSGSVPYDPLGI